jgi:hypothetical protein
LNIHAGGIPAGISFMSRSFINSRQKLKLISALPFDLATRALWFATPRGTLLCMMLAIYRSSSFLPR